jgi:hypothetical protein
MLEAQKDCLLLTLSIQLSSQPGSLDEPALPLMPATLMTNVLA